MSACDDCLRRTALVGRLASHVERARREQRHLRGLLALGDDKLIRALGGERRDELVRAHEDFDASAARAEIARARLTAICRHDEGYPPQLLEAADAPAVLHVAGNPQCLAAVSADDAVAVAVVGARRAGPDGLEVARGLGRGLAAAGVTVVSGMALGIDSAAHAGALEVGGPTLTVLAGGADVPYPPSKRGLYRAIVGGQAAISEMPPGMRPWRWCFPARNRTIAGLASLTIVVEAAERSGSLITADLAQELGRTVGAVPGPVNVPRCMGTNALLRDGALVIRDAQDALDEALGIGVATVAGVAERAAAQLDAPLRTLLCEVCDGRDTVAALATTPAQAQAAMAGLAELELLGFLRRGPGGRYVRLA
ncbi:MAG: processing protein [Solirubrobacteraceae bacterium]|jgi:DNA processing protein|nr:processing protein [Solirubrobacteraceae bacterium]